MLNQSATLLLVFLENSEQKTGQEHKFWQFWNELLYKLIILLTKHISVYCVLNKSFESLLETYNYSVIYQFWTCAFNTVVHWRELGEVKNECTSYNSGLFAIFVPKIIRFGGSLTWL